MEYQGGGTWGPQSGLAGYLNPFSRENGLTEGNPISYLAPKLLVNPNVTQYDYQTPSTPKLNVLGATTTNPNPYGPNPDERVTTVTKTTSQPTNTGGGTQTITEQDALRLGLDWNNLPSGYARAGGSPGDDVARREAETRALLDSGYGEYVRGLGGLKTSYEGERDSSVSSASELYDKIFGGLDEQKQANLDKLEAGRGAVNTRQVESIEDLKKNLGDVVRGMGMQLGAMGAGDTSAAKTMMPYAYTKIAGQQEGGIRRQANQQLFEIDQQERDTELEFSKMWKETETEKISQIEGIKQYYGNAIRNVEAAIAQAPLDKAKDLAALSSALLQESLSHLRNLESKVTERQDQLKSWATTRMAELNNAKIQLSGNANFNPRDIVWSELQMMGANPGVAGGAESMWNPMVAAKKVRDDYFS